MNDSRLVRKRVSFYGRVQGVGFRYTASYAARDCGVSGWVLNEYDGSVTMEVQGTEEQIDRVLSQIDSARYIRIDRIETKRIEVDPREKSFKVRY